MEIARLLEEFIPKERIRSRLIDLVAYASDAGFYYLRPKAVVLPVSEEEIISLFHFSAKHKIPLVFRAAGTSLSGQSVTDGILVDLSQHWSKVTVSSDGAQVRVQPGAIGAIVNAYLRKHGTKIGPDPASINSAMMGGIISNNSSGMCCGVSKNSYHTTRYLSFILPDGKRYSTESEADYKRFEQESAEIFNTLKSLRQQIITDPALLELVRHKYKTKNTVGYSVNAFIDHEHPLDILAHLMIGAEGTLGFISEAVMNTVPDYPEKATALIYFPTIYAACQAIVPLTTAGAEAVELMDRASLRSVEHVAGMPKEIKTLPAEAAALLVEFQGYSQDEVRNKIAAFGPLSATLDMLNPPVFTTNAAEQALYWKVRKGMFPAVGAVRASGSTVILEDIAFPVQHLGDAILDLQQLFKQYQYDNAIIFGHAKEGNIHFVVTQSFDLPAEVDRYDRFLRDMVDLVVTRYKGTLKAEHGTGRNMAPFVETEWGGAIYDVMKAVKAVIDPENLLNPGVIINADKAAHIADLKELPSVEEEVDRCMECGFCEHKCPSRDITLTPRKRIVVRRELVRLKRDGEKAEHSRLLDEYQYDGMDTCAVDGLCATACPVDINTGDLIKRLRRESHSDFANKNALTVAKNFGMVSKSVRFALGFGVGMNSVFGKKTMYRLTSGIKKIIPAFPLWSNQLALAPSLSKINTGQQHGEAAHTVVYYPTCISRVMGEPVKGQKSVMQAFMDVSAKANIKVVIPEGIGSGCCGQIYSSKGFKDAYTYTVNKTVEQLWEVTQQGKLPVVIDISSCTQTLLNCRYALTDENKTKFDGLSIRDSVDYVHDFVMPQATVIKRKQKVVLHPVCSLQKMPGLEAKFIKIAKHYADEVAVPLHAGCCGMAGDRGFLHPELTRSATKKEAVDAAAATCDGYYSSSKTCEIALSEAVGKNYQSILYLADECM